MPLAVYVLACRDDNYYVGVADNVEAAYMEHYMGVGSEWTRLHTPLRVERVIHNAESYDESALLREYFLLHGVDHVRGGPYTALILTETQKATVREMLEEVEADDLIGAFAKIALKTGVCARCGGEGHRARACIASHDINLNEIQSEGDYSDFEM
uniref:CCHC-type domain-containing protein n=1 Tax=viral metagenome TaxID=1070528 RepID=A0A6C0DT09_9ZZZZ